MRIRLTIKKTELQSYTYIFLLCLYTAVTVLASSNVDNVLFINKSLLYSFIGKWIGPALIVLFLWERKLKRSKLVVMAVLSFIVIAVSLNSQNRGFATMYAVMLAYPSELSAKKIAKWKSYTIFFTTAVILILYSLGLVVGDINIRGSITRISCGFISPNAFGNTVLIWMIIFIYYKFEDWNMKNTVLCIFITGIVFKLSNSRMSFIIEILVLVVIHIWIFKKDSNHKFLYETASWAYPCLTVLCYVITYIFSKGIFSDYLSVLNVFLSYRLGFMRKYLLEYGIKPFGQIIQTVSRSQQIATGEAWSGLDNSYMYILICWGLILSIILCVLYFTLGKYLKKKGDYIGALCVIALCIVGLTESYLSNVSYNLAVVLIAEMLGCGTFSLKKNEKEHKI